MVSQSVTSPTVDEPQLLIEDLQLALPGFAISDLSLQLAAGRCLVLLGPTGCGKTLVAEMLCGLRRPQSGRIVIAGREVTTLDPAERAIGYVPQDHALLPFKTVAGNIAFGLQSRRLPREVIDRRVDEMMARLGIGHLARRLPAGLSGGERQRVALARALVIRPQILVLDEPLSALDEGSGEDLITLLASLRRELGTTVLHICHRLDEAFALGDALAIMRAGRLVQLATPQHIRSWPASPFIARFLRLRNLLAGTVVDRAHGRFFCVGDTDWLACDLPCGPAQAVVPWHEIRLDDEVAQDGDERQRIALRIIANRPHDREPCLQLDGLSIPGIFHGDSWQSGRSLTCSLPRQGICILPANDIDNLNPGVVS